MARLASQVKRQFYPTPPRVTESIALHLRYAQDGHVAILDPCAGEGVALETLRQQGRNTLSYAVEVDEARALTCLHKGFTQTVQANTISEVKFAKHSYDLLWFNPPYDDDPEFGRLEMAFFKRCIIDDRVLVPGGVFVGILPKTSFNYLWPHIRDYFTDIRVMKFPVGEYEQFHQFVVFGVMRQAKRRMDDPSREKDTLMQLALQREEVPDLAEGLHGVFYDVPSREDAPKRIYCKVFQPHVAYQAAEKHGWMTKASTQDLFWPPPRPKVRTLLPLRPTFVGIAVGGGLFNNIPLLIDGELVLVKGQTVKAAAYVDSKVKTKADGDQKVEDNFVQQFRPRVFVLNLHTGQLVLYELPNKKPGEE